MSKLKKNTYLKLATVFCFLVLIVGAFIPAMTAKADTAEGQSGESFSAISSEEVSSEEVSSEEVSSEETSSVEQPQVFAGETTYNMSGGPKTIAAGSGDWILTGTYSGTAAGITVQNGYVGTITLNNVNITTTANVPAMILESTGGNNNTPTTKVELILASGSSNSLITDVSGTSTTYAGLDVMLGTQVTIDGTGSLTAKSSSSPSTGGGGAAGIGSGRRANCGGNIIIKGGTVTATGGYHGAGVGGSWYSPNYANTIVIGGNVTSIGGAHGSGIGGGCAGTKGYIVVLPPATISSSSVGGRPAVGQSTGSSVYIGDPSQPITTFKTVESTPNIPVYVNFAGLPDVVKGLNQAGLSTAEIQKYQLGTADSAGNYGMHANVTQSLTYFTDAVSTLDGAAFLSQDAVANKVQTIVFPRANADVQAVITTPAGTANPPDLLPSVDPTLSATYNQVVTITNNGNMALGNITATLTGADAGKFDIITAPATTLAKKTGATGPTTTVVIRPKNGLLAGTYTPGLKLSFTGKDGTPPAEVTVTVPDINMTLKPQQVGKKGGVVGTDGNVVASFQPSNNWSNTASLGLTASASTTAGDAVETWTYARTTSATAPAAGDSAWTTVSGGTTTATVNFPANVEDTYYIHWTLETKFADGMSGTISNSGVTTYKIDRIAPTVTSITTTATEVDSTALPVTITFSEPVTTLVASNISVTNGSVIASTIASVGTPVNGKYTTFTVDIQPSATIVGGDTVSVKIPANVTQDKGTNGNIGSDASGTSFDITVNVKSDVSAVLTSPTGTPPDLLYQTDPSLSLNYDQIITITNSGNINVNTIVAVLDGPNAGNFVIKTAPSATLTKAGGGSDTTTVVIRPKNNLAVGTYTVNVKITAKGVDSSGTAVAIPDMVVSSKAQKVVKRSGTSADGQITPSFNPSSTYKNNATIDLTASANTTVNPGDAVESWTYAVTTSPTAPGAGDPAWTTVSGGTTTATHTFTPNMDQIYFIHWTLETTFISALNDTVTDSGTSTYKIDRIAPTVTSFTTTVSSVGTVAFPVTVTFSEPVDPITAADINVTNGSVTGAVSPTGTAANGQYTTYDFYVLPNPGLTAGQKVTVSIPANITQDKAGNDNVSSDASGSNTDKELIVSTDSPIATYSYTDQYVFVAQPGSTAIKVTLTSNGKTTKDLYEAGTTTLLSAGYAPQFISVNGAPIDNVTLVATMAKVRNDYEYTITSATGFSDGEYKVEIAPNMVENSEGNKLSASTQSFYVEIPVITGITATPPTLGYQGGISSITVVGKYLNRGTIEVNSSVDGQNTLPTVSADGLSATIPISIPTNSDYLADKVYTFYPLLNGAANPANCTVTVDRKTAVVNYDANGGSPETQSTPSVYNTPIPAPAVTPTKRAARFIGWTKDSTNTDPTTATLVNIGVDLHDVNGDMTLYAVWERTDWIITFDVNGGDVTSLPVDILIPITNTTTKEGTANLDIYAPDGSDQPYYQGYSYLGLTEGTAGGTVVKKGAFSLGNDLTVVANWTKTSVTPIPNPNPTPTPSAPVNSLPYEIPSAEPGTSSGTGMNTVNPDFADSIGDPVYGTYSNIAGSGVYVTYKDESTVTDVEGNLVAVATYTDLYGNVHTSPVYTSWNTSVLHDGGVSLLEFYTIDNRGNSITSADCYGTVFVLNRPYLRANDVHYIFEAEGVTGEEYNPYAYVEIPLLSEGRIARVKIPSPFDLMGADTQTAGTYGVGFNATFTDAFGTVFNLHKDSVLVVRAKAKPTKEDEAQANSSEFWVAVAEIYHKMQPGQVIEINESNYKDGGRLLDEKIASDANYDRLIKVTPGSYVYMNPCILDRIRVDKKGEMQVYLSGRTLTFNSKDYQTNPERSYAPKGYFDLRMGVDKNEKITQLVGADTPQMQLRFEMNRAWYAEPYFTIKVNDQMNALAEAGSTLYLFNYNPDTNELEMIGPMAPVTNGNYRIQVKGIYKDYVILAELPKEAGYRITDRTNTLGSRTLGEIGQNYVNSGKAKTVDEGLNAANVTYQRISGDGTFDSLGEYEATTGNKISSQKNGKILPITIGSITGVGLLAGGGYLFYKKKKHLGD